MKSSLRVCAILASAALWTTPAVAQQSPTAPPAPAMTGETTPLVAPDESRSAPRIAPAAPETLSLDTADQLADTPGHSARPQVGTSTAPMDRVAASGAETAPTDETAPPAEATDPSAATPSTTLTATAQDASERALDFLRNGGPAIWAIAALSVITLALVLWKAWRLALIGAWSRGKTGRAIELYLSGDAVGALALVDGRRGIRSRVMSTTLRSIDTMSDDTAREETARVAKRHLSAARDGLGALELIATIAPLLGLLGTVLGMIAAFQALQAAGSRADPALLAGGIWEALLTTAAGMAVAIPASVALTWFDSVIERIRRDIEDNSARVFVATASAPAKLKLAAE